MRQGGRYLRPKVVHAAAPTRHHHMPVLFQEAEYPEGLQWRFIPTTQGILQKALSIFKDSPRAFKHSKTSANCQYIFCSDESKMTFIDA